jgi:FAD/FMN-containing dehydrogenase
MARVPAEESAFGHRDKGFMLSAISEWLDPAEDAQHLSRVIEFFDELKPYAAGVYVNFLQEEGEKRIREAYEPEVFERLADVKAHYDPTNLFRQNQNIKPA